VIDGVFGAALEQLVEQVLGAEVDRTAGEEVAGREPLAGADLIDGRGQFDAVPDQLLREALEELVGVDPGPKISVKRSTGGAGGGCGLSTSSRASAAGMYRL
jgi:hypothetical protein